MPGSHSASRWTELTPEERRGRRRLRREKQREDNVKRAAKMHAARLKTKANSSNAPSHTKRLVYVGCSGWRYWKWRNSFYADVPQQEWFEHYLKRFDTVEINANLLLMAHSSRRSGLETCARQKEVCVHREGLRDHHSCKEVQRHKDPHSRFRTDCRHSRRPDGLLPVSGANCAWIYFNNDFGAHAPKNAAVLRRLLTHVSARSAVPKKIAPRRSA